MPVKVFLSKGSLLTIVLLSFLLLSSCMTTTPVEIEPLTTQITYNIGDVGPAQGLIFFDKGEFIDGWRYLEVAPATTEVSLQWSSTESLVDNTSVDIGEGKYMQLPIVMNYRLMDTMIGFYLHWKNLILYIGTYLELN